MTRRRQRKAPETSPEAQPAALDTSQPEAPETSPEAQPVAKKTPTVFTQSLRTKIGGKSVLIRAGERVPEGVDVDALLRKQPLLDPQHPENLRAVAKRQEVLEAIRRANGDDQGSAIARLARNRPHDALPIGVA